MIKRTNEKKKEKKAFENIFLIMTKITFMFVYIHLCVCVCVCV